MNGPVEAAVHLLVDEVWSLLPKCILTKLHKTKSIKNLTRSHEKSEVNNNTKA
jgi:hypothetical protein